MLSNKQTFSKNLKYLLCEKEINAARLAERTGIENSQISSWIRCKFLPSLKNIIKVADYFSTSIDFLLGLSFSREFKADSGINFNKSLQRILRIEDIKQKEMSFECGLNPMTLTHWKQGDMPRLDNLINLAKFLNLPIEYIIAVAQIKKDYKFKQRPKELR